MRPWFVVAGIAAMLLIAVGVVAVRINLTPAPSTGALGTGDETAAKAPSMLVKDKPNSIPEVLATRDRTTPPAPRKTARHRVKRTDDSNSIAKNNQPGNSNTSAAEVTTGFMPLGHVSLANLQEGAQVVRVEMPRYAMARFGLPVNMERYDEFVKADVWLGADGLARAIRFVQ
jgi:hypothetical protein